MSPRGGEKLQKRGLCVLRFIFLDFMEPLEDRVFSGAHRNSPGNVP